jgi:hypothetical protein
MSSLRRERSTGVSSNPKSCDDDWSDAGFRRTTEGAATDSSGLKGPGWDAESGLGIDLWAGCAALDGCWTLLDVLYGFWRGALRDLGFFVVVVDSVRIAIDTTINKIHHQNFAICNSKINEEKWAAELNKNN